MTICDRFDVVVVPFPFVDRGHAKPRPTLVLSSSAFNEANAHSILAMITTAARSRWPSDLTIKATQAAGLKTASMIRWKVFTLPNGLISRRIGHLAARDASAVRQHLRFMLEIA